MKAADPSSGIMTYLGEKTLDFAEGETFYAFHVDNSDFGGPDQEIYFNTQTKQMEYAVTDDSQEIIIHTENGPQPATYTDADFVLPAACDNVPVNPDFPTTFGQFTF